jgi:1-aminocyclopropane-1-carboxylate deaminase/D-cysteine desulfhydrase-like pyridoxal-dependent ACC family enzyme
MNRSICCCVFSILLFSVQVLAADEPHAIWTQGNSPEAIDWPGSSSIVHGMVVGFAADGWANRVIGIDASAKPQQTHEQILRIAQSTAKKVELDREITADDVVLETRYGGPEYGLPSEGTLAAIRLCAKLEGVLTDPVYGGKSMHGMIDLVQRGAFPAGSKVLYAHLDGVPALNSCLPARMTTESIRCIREK